MAEGLLGGILRDDEEAPVEKAPEALAGPEALAVAIADHASSQDPELARKLAAILSTQAQLLEIQAEHLGYPHRLRLEYHCSQPREARPGLPTHSIRTRRRAFDSLIETFERSTQSLP